VCRPVGKSRYVGLYMSLAKLQSVCLYPDCRGLILVLFTDSEHLYLT
jgi:hypothetical protein